MEKAKERDDYPLIVPKSYNGDGREEEVEDDEKVSSLSSLAKEGAFRTKTQG